MATTAFAQKTDTTFRKNRRADDFALMIGYNGVKYQFAEIGIGVNRYCVPPPPKFDPPMMIVSTTYFAGSEFMLDKKPTIAPKIGIYITGFVAFGLNAVYYMNTGGQSLRLRPEIGLGMGSFKLTYGYNIAVTNKEFYRLNKNVFSFVFPVYSKRLK